MINKLFCLTGPEARLFMHVALGKRHAIHILKTMESQEFFRFTELKQIIPEISGTVLSERLDELEKLNLIQKHEDSNTNTKYSLTQKNARTQAYH